MAAVFEIRAHWDADASVWWADSDQIIGLVAEAPTVELLVEELRGIVPEIMALNSQGTGGPINLRVVATRDLIAA